MYNVKTLNLSDFSHTNLPNLHDRPKELYLRGEVKLDIPLLAVVGTRRPTAYGLSSLRSLMEGLKGREVGIVSGLALGIDVHSHKIALDLGLHVVAVLPCGIETIYPKSHLSISKRILSSGGGLISEYPGVARPHKYNFIARNRIIAGLSSAILIPEAAERSGSLHTAGFGMDLGIPILAVPGPINSANSRGTNSLIDKGAKLTSSSEDILDELGLEAGPTQTKLTFSSREEQAIYEYLLQGPCEIDDIITATNLDQSVLQQTLTMMELDGSVQVDAGKWFIK